MSNLEDTVDAATQWVEEREASCQTEEDMMVDSFSQTLHMGGLMAEQEEEEEEELGHDEGTQTMLSDSVTLALAILANRSEYHPSNCLISDWPLALRISICHMFPSPGCCMGSTPSSPSPSCSPASAPPPWQGLPPRQAADRVEHLCRSLARSPTETRGLSCDASASQSRPPLPAANPEGADP